MCDPQLFQEHVWFWEAGLKVRTLEMMIPIYHDICGRGMVMELDFAIDRRGLVPDSHAAVYAQLGEWVRGCYGSPLAMSSGQGGEYVVTVQAGQVLDRFQLQENTLLGQRVRQYTIESQPAATGNAAARANSVTSWKHLVSGQAIGTKRIILLPAPVTVTSDLRVRLRIVQSVAKPILRFFGVFQPCFPNATAV
jgi:alpha-L-fucosidase